MREEGGRVRTAGEWLVRREEKCAGARGQAAGEWKSVSDRSRVRAREGGGSVTAKTIKTDASRSWVYTPESFPYAR